MHHGALTGTNDAVSRVRKLSSVHRQIALPTQTEVCQYGSPADAVLRAMQRSTVRTLPKSASMFSFQALDLSADERCTVRMKCRCDASSIIGKQIIELSHGMTGASDSEPSSGWLAAIDSVQQASMRSDLASSIMAEPRNAVLESCARTASDPCACEATILSDSIEADARRPRRRIFGQPTARRSRQQSSNGRLLDRSPSSVASARSVRCRISLPVTVSGNLVRQSDVDDSFAGSSAPD